MGTEEGMRKLVMSVVPEEMRFTRTADGWLLAADVQLEDGSVGRVTMRIKAPVLSVNAKSVEAISPASMAPPYVQHGTWLEDYVLTVTAYGNPSAEGGTLSMRRLGEAD